MLHHARPDAMFRALADPGRLSMVEALAEAPCSLGELAANYDMTLTAVGQHVKVLERAGLVATSKVGRVRMCRIAPAAFDQLDLWVRQRRATIERRLDRLEAHLAKTEIRE